VLQYEEAGDYPSGFHQPRYQLIHFTRDDLVQFNHPAGNLPARNTEQGTGLCRSQTRRDQLGRASALYFEAALLQTGDPCALEDRRPLFSPKPLGSAEVDH
jgi:hypothetical protein